VRARGGRPPKPPQDVRNKGIELRLSEAEYAELCQRADGRPLSDWVRKVLLGRERNGDIPITNLAVVGQLAKLGNNLKQLLRLAHSGRAAARLLPLLTDLYKLLSTYQSQLLGGLEAERQVRSIQNPMAQHTPNRPMSWRKLLQAGFEPRLYPADGLPTGTRKVILMATSWHRNLTAVVCFFRDLDSQQCYRISVFRDVSTRKYGPEGLDFSLLAPATTLTIEIHQNTTGTFKIQTATLS
jgi:hypothetical protein